MAAGASVVVDVRFENRNMTRRIFVTVLPLSLLPGWAQERYSGPRPPKKDVAYLLEAGKLIQTEMQQITESKSKGGRVFSVSGTTSPARTPLPEPIFLFSSGRISAAQLDLYRFEVKNGRREVAAQKNEDDNDEDLRITLRQLDEGLYRIEASHMLDPGEYALSAKDDNTAFCFTVY